MSADARLARAIRDVRREMDQRLVPQELRNAVENLANEAADPLGLTDDIEKH